MYVVSPYVRVVRVVALASPDLATPMLIFVETRKPRTWLSGTSQYYHVLSQTIPSHPLPPPPIPSHPMYLPLPPCTLLDPSHTLSLYQKLSTVVYVPLYAGTCSLYC